MRRIGRILLVAISLGDTLTLDYLTSVDELETAIKTGGY